MKSIFFTKGVRVRLDNGVGVTNGQMFTQSQDNKTVHYYGIVWQDYDGHDVLSYCREDTISLDVDPNDILKEMLCSE